MSQGDLPAEEAIAAEFVQPDTLVQRRPWGFWATIGFSIAVTVAFIAIQTAVALALQRRHEATSGDADRYACVGLFLSVATWVAAPLCFAIVILLVKLRRQLSIREYLSFRRVSAGSFLGWAAVMLVFAGLSDVAIWLLGRPIACDFTIDVYRTAVFVPLLLATLWIAAPVFEETLVRGFMFQGIQQSRLGNPGAILITALVWSLTHMQYDAYGMWVIFLSGILLGIARAKTDSVYLTIGLHSMMNVVATIELWVYLGLQP
jgi:uncharacterized protein